jgi:NAD-dependent dihydropyrimidine dehydrogenase PreA subunit
MRTVRKIIEIDEELCDGCGQCVPSCTEGALQIVDGKARLVSEVYCDGLGACLGECPTGALRTIERDAEEFNAEAVEKYLEEKEKTDTPAEIPVHCACPSAHVQSFTSPCEQENRLAGLAGMASALSHWPVQIRLVPPAAPFLKGANLLVAADCVPVAYPNFHSGLLSGKAVMIGCPKFDDVREYIYKFAEIFRDANIRSVTVADMEVPCCSKLPMIVKKGMEIAGKDVPMEEIIITTQGAVLRQAKYVA